MPISFGSSSSESTANYIRVNLPQNRWRIGDEPIDMTRGLAIDVKNVIFGWLHIDVGVRDWQPWPSPSSPTPKPSDNHKNGFELQCWAMDGRPASLSGNSFGLGQWVSRLYNQCETMPEWNEDKVPIVQVTGTTPVVVGRGTSYDIQFVVSKFINRPGAQAAAPAAPAAAPAPQAGPADLNDFGF